MKPELLFSVIVGVIVFEFILERVLDFLNASRWSDRLPDELKGIYNEEDYRKSQAYARTNFKFSQITSLFSLVVILVMLFANGFAWVDQLAGLVSDNPIWKALLFFAILGLGSDILNMPFSLYDTFVIEERFGFNKMTIKTYFLDKIKGWLLGCLLGGGLMAAIIWIYLQTTSWFWLVAWAALAFFTIFMTMFYSHLIVPLFNKQTPMEAGSLRDAIEAFSKKVGFALDNVYVMDGSKRTTKANAYFTGFGKRKRIVLFDTLIQDLTTEEVVGVLAHEIGHYKKRHVIMGLGASLVQSALMFYLLGLFVGNPVLSQALGVADPGFHIGLIAFGILYSPLSTIMGVVFNMLSRTNEYEADRFAGHYFQPESLETALKKLSVKSLSNLRPHPAYVFFHYSHPTLLQRLGALRKNKTVTS